MLLFQDEKGPIAAKTYGGTSWCSTQAKIERAQKIKGILNVFGVYDHTNDRMITHCYKNKKSKQFMDFIERVELLYHGGGIDPDIDHLGVNKLFYDLSDNIYLEARNYHYCIHSHPEDALELCMQKVSD